MVKISPGSFARADRWAASPTASSTPHLRVASRVLLPVALFVLSLTINLVHVDSTSFHPDETRWINRAHFASDLLEPFGPTWQDQYLTRGQPPLGSYLMGFGLLVQGRDTQTNGVWDFAYSPEWNRSVGAMASAADLEAARRTNAVVGAATVVLVFFLGQALFGRVAGVAGGVMLALHPLHIWISSQALSDQLLVLLISAASLVAIRLARQPSRGVALALGILLGLGGATKLFPLLMTVPLAIYGLALIVLVRNGRIHAQNAERIGSLLLWQPLIATATFVAVYPYLWPAPIQRTWNLFALRTDEMRGQSNAWPDVAVDNAFMAIVRILDQLTVVSSTTGDLMGAMIGWFGVDAHPWGFDIPLAVIGVGILGSLCVRRGPTSDANLASLILGGTVAAIVVGMRVDFYRYHLPVTLVVCLLAGMTMSEVWHQLAIRGAWRVWNLIPGVSIAGPDTATTYRDDAPLAQSSGPNRKLRTGGNQ